MSSLRDRLDAASEPYRVPSDAWPRLEKRVAARRLSRRLATIATALVVGAGGITVVLTAFSAKEKAPVAPATVGPGTVAAQYGRIVYIGDDQTIFTMKADGTDKRQITTRATPFPAFEPSWSPDGSQIAFNGVFGPLEDDRGIYVVNADGSEVPSRLVRGDGHRTPAWSPDGKTIAVDGITLLSVNGAPPVRLTSDYGYSPTWSPDGSQLAYVAAPPTQRHTQIFAVGADGSGNRQLTDLESAEDPAWSPGGGQIAFEAELKGAPSLALMNTDGTAVRRLASCFSCSPSWSPDGSLILFACHNGHLCTIRPDGTGLTMIIDDRSDYSQPQWQPLGGPVSDTTPVATFPPEVASALLERAMSAARANGDADPIAIEAVLTTRGRVDEAYGDKTGDPAQSVYLVQTIGSFVCGTCKGPSGASAISGPSMMFVMSTDLSLTDFACCGGPRDLSTFGTVVDLLAQPPPNAGALIPLRTVWSVPSRYANAIDSAPGELWASSLQGGQGSTPALFRLDEGNGSITAQVPTSTGSSFEVGGGGLQVAGDSVFVTGQAIGAGPGGALLEQVQMQPPNGAVQKSIPGRFGVDTVTSPEGIWVLTNAGTNQAQLTLLDPKDNGVLSTVSLGTLYPRYLAATDGYIVVAGQSIAGDTVDGGVVVTVDASTGAIVAQRDSPGVVRGLANGMDGSVWAAMDGGVGMVDASTASIGELIDVPDFIANGIAPGAHGQIWLFGHFGTGEGSSVVEVDSAHRSAVGTAALPGQSARDITVEGEDVFVLTQDRILCLRT